MSNLKLVTTETFGNIVCNFYRNMNDDILLTREQIGQALEYANPSKAIQKIHLKHKDRLDSLYVRIKLTGYPQTGNNCTQNGANLRKKEEQERVYYSERGIMEICRWSRQPKANQFMDWCWDIIENYRHGNGVTTKEMASLLSTVSTLTNTITELHKDITSLKQKVNNPISIQQPSSAWLIEMFPKFKILEKHLNISRTELYRKLYISLKQAYEIDVDQLKLDYCVAYGLLDCHPMSAIAHNKKARTYLTGIIDALLKKYKLQKNTDSLDEIFNFDKVTITREW
ncbi:hypothetical protein H8S37_04475 [Mediterraneibacter sp. NSJ-55]|uniref:Bro-N domain-containing protein n=1 Tax=Mediterraneibacter hominis TaxID=2763054 RepID=A0A923LH44_9FIRM|nr:BRO family protein [Mediterraneibacter hominis]MBC5688189.1 hypothetical protein [Mediterraneibacter hominis]